MDKPNILIQPTNDDRRTIGYMTAYNQWYAYLDHKCPTKSNSRLAPPPLPISDITGAGAPPAPDRTTWSTFSFTPIPKVPGRLRTWINKYQRSDDDPRPFPPLLHYFLFWDDNLMMACRLVLLAAVILFNIAAWQWGW